MSFWADYKTVTDKWGLIQPPGGNTSGNGVRYTAEMILAALKHDKLTPSKKNKYRQALAACERQAGLLMRTPDNAFGYQSIDDTVGMITASYYLDDAEFAEDWLIYGNHNGADLVDDQDPNKDKVSLSRKLFWLLRIVLMSKRVKYTYNNQNPEHFAVSSWLGRFPHLIAHAEFAAGEDPPLWRKLWWCFTVMHATRADSPDGWALTVHLVKIAKGKSWLCDRAANFFRKRFKKKYPGGMGQVLGEYWGDHPNTKYLEGEFGD